MKNIMKGEINDILKGTSKTQKTKKIELIKVTIDDIIPLCMNFNLHRQLQMQLPIISNDYQMQNISDIHTFGYINQVNDILKTDQYAYVKTGFNLYAYVGKVKFDVIYNTDFVEISTQNKKYYDRVISLFEKDKKSIKINNYVEIQNHKGIYEYVLTGNIRNLNLRQFDENIKRAIYEKQKGICAICKKHFEYNEMHADHKKAWSNGGKTIPDNCQMLCTKCNLEKSANDSGH